MWNIENMAKAMNRFDPESIIRSVRPYSMVSDVGLRFTIEAVRGIFDRGVLGSFVECGVWKGGSSIAMMLAQKQLWGKVPRTVHMLDSFQGLPPVDHCDGPAAAAWQENTTSPDYHDNCRANRFQVEHALTTFGLGTWDGIIWEGWFRETIPSVLGCSGSIALLRLDCDWYAPVRECLEAFVPRMTHGGVVIIDDYFAWDGCARAVHEYLAKHDLPYRVRTIPPEDGAYFVVI